MTDSSDDKPAPSGRASLERDHRGGSFVNDFISSVAAILGIGVLLFAISGVWPPMVAIESPSMEPNIDTNDLVFVMEETRFPSQYQVGDTGVATKESSNNTGFKKFERHGDVIVYSPNGNTNLIPVIHRAMFHVEAGENWYEKTDPAYLPNEVDSCSDLTHCPANASGFITLGDNNGMYDQVAQDTPLSRPVKAEWIIGTAEFRMPGLGWLRLTAMDTTPVGTADAATLAAP
jgi:signal peptidase